MVPFNGPRLRGQPLLVPLLLPFFVFAAAPAVSAAATETHPTMIWVTAGKPTEFSFKLSRYANLPAGTIAFKVTNQGLSGHDFKVCTTPVTSSTATTDTCKGLVTKVLYQGQSQTLRVTLKKAGTYEFLCTVAGHAAGGMKGLFGVGRKPLTPAPPPMPSVTHTACCPVPVTCTSPKSTSVTVTMIDDAFQGMPSTLPCGTVNVTEVNAGQQAHNIDFSGAAVIGGVGPVIGPGATAGFTMVINTGAYAYRSDVGSDAANGMVGSVSVTG